MTTSVIKTIEDMATAEGMKTLQLMTKSGRILYDFTWITGVDFTEQDDDQESYHYKRTAPGLFLSKRGRPDISPVIAYSTTTVKNPNQDDWMKLIKMMIFLN
jgi:hypothetical protein